MFNVVLVNPEIPPNTGNIGRLTLGTQTKLTIVGQPAFDLSDDAALKRAGLDYWNDVDLHRYPDWSDYRNDRTGNYRLITKYGDQPYHEAEFQPGDQLIFGGENHGVPETVHEDPAVQRYHLPMSDSIRAFNVCNAVAVVLFEALRQTDPDWFSETPFSRESPASTGQ